MSEEIRKTRCKLGRLTQTIYLATDEKVADHISKIVSDGCELIDHQQKRIDELEKEVEDLKEARKLYFFPWTNTKPIIEPGP